jgi:hypothetical protein
MADECCRNVLELLLQNNSCRGILGDEMCLTLYDCTDKAERHFPMISPVCWCTMCLKCVHAQHEAAVKNSPDWKGWTIECMLCSTPKAWNIRKLVPNLALASMLEETRRLAVVVAPVAEGDEDSEATIALCSK